MLFSISGQIFIKIYANHATTSTYESGKVDGVGSLNADGI
jgi:hypothetical protein